VLANLLDNAVKYTQEGGRVSVRARAGSGRVRVEVVDDGPGVEPKHRGRLFERFYRADPGRSREMGGTGLGLAIVKHLVLAMGGEVGMEPAEPSGSRFWFTLPA
jgi:two-component system phosphate regulon sensor histidine kinase PhoR